MSSSGASTDAGDSSNSSDSSQDASALTSSSILSTPSSQPSPMPNRTIPLPIRPYPSASNHTKKASKRGLAYNDPSLTVPFSQANHSSKISWTYNWYSYPYTSGQNLSGYNLLLEYVPMLWSNATALTDAWFKNVDASVKDYKTTAVQAFNEPDGCSGGGSCMDLNSSVSAYRAFMNPLAGKLRLGAPAVTNGNGTMVGLDYLKKFLHQCEGCQIDFVPIHWLGNAGDTSGFKAYVKHAHAVAHGKPLWVTLVGTTYGTEQENYAFLREVMTWMDRHEMVERYAWFMDSPGSLINSNGTGLSALGNLYNSG